MKPNPDKYTWAPDTIEILPDRKITTPVKPKNPRPK